MGGKVNGMLQKKICLLGCASVGKTSLVTRYVQSSFSDRYMSTIGAKVDTKIVVLDPGLALRLVIWDLAAADDFTQLTCNYLRGASGYLIVCDGTTRKTWNRAIELQRLTEQTLGAGVPFVLAINKRDLKPTWEVPPDLVAEKARLGWHVLETSARTGENVGALFLTLSKQLDSRSLVSNLG